MRRVVRPAHPEWPERLGELGGLRPPERLFVEGLPLCKDMPAVAVVGTRRPTGAGVAAARAVATGLAEGGFAVISGLAVGIDAVAHRAALDAGGKTIAVLGCGLDVDYPRRNVMLKRDIARAGTLVSEYEDGTPPMKANFPLRNRIIAGLSVGVVVVEGGMRSGALVTARLALDSNRNVYAVPGSVRNPMAEGPNELIRTGRATLVTSAKHVFDDLAPALVWSEPHGAAPPELDDEERIVAAALDDVPLGLDRLATETGMPPGKLAVALAKLEVRGIVGRSRGGYVRA